eukprot:744890-Amorphochlora_amoeboformis.AAC.1
MRSHASLTRSTTVSTSRPIDAEPDPRPHLPECSLQDKEFTLRIQLSSPRFQCTIACSDAFGTNSRNAVSNTRI